MAHKRHLTSLIELADEGVSVRDGQIKVISQGIELRCSDQVTASQLAALCQRAQEAFGLLLLIAATGDFTLSSIVAMHIMRQGASPEVNC